MAMAMAYQEQAAIEARVDDADRTLEVQAQPKDGAAPVTLLEGGKWTDSVAMRSLLQYLQLRCAEMDKPAA